MRGLPALPAIALGFLLPNADLVWRDVRRARAAGYRVDLSDDTDSTCGVCGNMSTGRQRSSS